MREVKDCFYYIPLLSSLQAMLKCKDISDQVGYIYICTNENLINAYQYS